MKPKILATAWHPGSANAILPVIKRLQEEGKVDVEVIGHGFSEKIFNAQDVDYKTVQEYASDDVSLDSAKFILNQEQPNMVLTGVSAQDEKNKDVIEQTTTLAAKEKGIPSLAVLDFWGTYAQRFSDKYTGEQLKFLPTKIAIMDDYAKKDMMNEGFNPEQLVITGNPHFDNLEAKARSFTNQEKKEIREQIGMEDKTLLFYAANAWKKDNHGYWDLDNLEIMNEALHKLPAETRENSGVVAKLHPRAPEDEVAEIKQYLNAHSDGEIVLATDIHPQDLILATDVTVTPFSTVGIEAAYMGKPCISLQPNCHQDQLAILTFQSIAPVAYDNIIGEALINDALSKPEFRDELEKQSATFKNDGKATERVTEVVYEMLGL